MDKAAELSTSQLAHNIIRQIYILLIYVHTGLVLGLNMFECDTTKPRYRANQHCFMTKALLSSN